MSEDATAYNERAENAKAAVKYQYDFRIESFKATMQFSSNAMRGLFLINSGAIIAILGFFSSILQKDYKPLEKNYHLIFAAQEMTGPLEWFLVGLVLAILCSGFTYLSQGIFSRFTKSSDRVAFPIQIFCIILGVLSLVAFGLGAVFAAEILKHAFS